MNPVVAGMVRKPEEYSWSSYRVNAWGAQSDLVNHDEYLGLGFTAEERCRAYRELFRYQIPDEDIHLIERASHYCHPVGDDGSGGRLSSITASNLDRLAEAGQRSLQEMVSK